MGVLAVVLVAVRPVVGRLVVAQLVAERRPELFALLAAFVAPSALAAAAE